MRNEVISISKSQPLTGAARLNGAKNAVLVIMASLILARGRSVLTNVPSSADVHNMILLLQQLGAEVMFVQDMHMLIIDTMPLHSYIVEREIMKKMRASILVMGPLLARFGKAAIALPGGCTIGTRPIDLHLKHFADMGVLIQEESDAIEASVSAIQAKKIVLAYPSVGATENIMMLAVMAKGTTCIVNAALEPEVMDLITVLNKMGARITVAAPATIEIEGVHELHPIEHGILYDRLEAGAILVAAAITGGRVRLPEAPAFAMEVFLHKLIDMGHCLQIGVDGVGVELYATQSPKAVSLKTGPYPQFPTDLQAIMSAALCVADGVSVIEETVFENRFMHVRELQKMGAEIKIVHDQKAIITGVEQLYGAHVIAPDIRSSCALVLAGLAAEGNTVMSGVQHFRRAYDALDKTLNSLGADIHYVQELVGTIDMKATIQKEMV